MAWDKIKRCTKCGAGCPEESSTCIRCGSRDLGPAKVPPEPHELWFAWLKALRAADDERGKWVELDIQVRDQWPKTLTQAVDRLLTGWSEESRQIFRDTPRDELLRRYHHGLGTGIRNDFGLSRGNTALLADCGHWEMHADAASSVILQAVWNKLHGLPPANARLQNYRTCREVYQQLGPEKSYLKLLQDSGHEGFAREATRYLFGLDEQQAAEVAAGAKLPQDERPEGG